MKVIIVQKEKRNLAVQCKQANLYLFLYSSESAFCIFHASRLSTQMVEKGHCERKEKIIIIDECAAS